MRIVARLDFASDKEILQRLNVESGGLVQRVIDSEVIRQCEPYVPFDEGVLTASAMLATNIGSGLVVYDTPYAHYMYYGEVYGPNIPKYDADGDLVGFWSPPIKHPTGKKLTYNLEKHPQAGSHWFDRAMADHKDEVLEAARKAAGAK